MCASGAHLDARDMLPCCMSCQGHHHEFGFQSKVVSGGLLATVAGYCRPRITSNYQLQFLNSNYIQNKRCSLFLSLNFAYF
jgi:hypothetical protein